MNWAEKHAREIINLFPDKEEYVCASGITPSGFIHVGNFREYFTVDLVVQELRKLGKKVKHIHSWDNFDPFRKVPKNIPEERKEEYQNYIGMCITDIPDPWNKEKSYADFFIRKFEDELKMVGCSAEYLYQEKIYRATTYKEGIKLALINRSKVMEVYNKFRKEPLEDNWWPVTLWCEKCNKITDIILGYDGNYTLDYKCKNCNHEGKLNFSENGNVKLRWRVDWPMRWAYYNETFEPSGKDHMSSGGSNDLAKILIQDVYNKEPPYVFMYEFIGVKGGAGKMSSSSGNVYTISDILRYYIPEAFRFLYVSTKPNSNFDIQLDENIFQRYEEFYSLEKKYYDYLESENKDEKIDPDILKEYEMSNVWKTNKRPYQPKPQEILVLNQVLGDDAVNFYIKINNLTEKEDLKRVKQISECMKNWLEDFSIDKYICKTEASFDENIKAEIIYFLENNEYDKEYQNNFYNYMKSKNINIKDAFKNFYILLFKKSVGPKFSNIIEYFGKDIVLDKIKKI